MSGDDYQAIFEARGHLYNRAMARFPDARLRERRLLIERLKSDNQRMKQLLWHQEDNQGKI